MQQQIESPFLKDMPEYPFDRDKLTMVFNNTIGDCIAESLLTDIVYSGKEFNHVGDFRIWTEEEETYILHLPSGTIVGWYKFIHIGRCNFCNKPDMGFNDLRDFFMLLRNQLLEESDLPSDECVPRKKPVNIDPQALMRKLQINSIYGIGDDENVIHNPNGSITYLGDGDEEDDDYVEE